MFMMTVLHLTILMPSSAADCWMSACLRPLVSCAEILQYKETQAEATKLANESISLQGFEYLITIYVWKRAQNIYHHFCILSRLVQLLGADDDGVPEAGGLDGPLDHLLDLPGEFLVSVHVSDPQGTEECSLQSDEQNCNSWWRSLAWCAPGCRAHHATAI